MARSRLFFGSVAVCGLLCGLFFAGPYIALHQIRGAANSGDADALSQYVDLDRVRTNTKIRLRASVEKAIASRHSGFALVGAAIAGTALDPMVDSVVSPQTISSWVKQTPSGGRGGEPKTATRFLSLSEFSATVGEGKGAVELVLTRNYLRWRLTDVRLDLSLDQLMSQLKQSVLGGFPAGFGNPPTPPAP